MSESQSLPSSFQTTDITPDIPDRKSSFTKKRQEFDRLCMERIEKIQDFSRMYADDLKRNQDYAKQIIKAIEDVCSMNQEIRDYFLARLRESALLQMESLTLEQLAFNENLFKWNFYFLCAIILLSGASACCFMLSHLITPGTDTLWLQKTFLSHMICRLPLWYTLFIPMIVSVFLLGHSRSYVLETSKDRKARVSREEHFALALFLLGFTVGLILYAYWKACIRNPEFVLMEATAEL